LPNYGNKGTRCYEGKVSGILDIVPRWSYMFSFMFHGNSPKQPLGRAQSWLQHGDDKSFPSPTSKETHTQSL
jgi:hypothetical protein